MNQGARFTDDNGIGFGSTQYKFNEKSYQSLCDLIGVKPNFLRDLQEYGLASRTLNDLFLSGSISRKMDSLEIVCDEDSNQVLGFVSESYVGYSNRLFVNEVLAALDPDKNTSALFPDLGDFEFQQGYSVNSRLYLRVTSKKVVGEISGLGGHDEDISKIGLELTNTMAGGYALRLSYYILRLICANGLTAPVSKGSGKIIHSGTEKSFERRLNRAAGAALRSLSNATRLLDNLAGIPFDPWLLAGTTKIDDVFAIVPELDLKSDCKKAISSKDYSSIPGKKERAMQKKADMLEAISSLIGRPHSLSVFNSSFRDNASMWDYINIFTEYAKELDIQQKLETERRAGEMAYCMSRNKRKFTPQFS
jgi:hypothetical protein